MVWTDGLLRLGVALVLSFPIGWERETGQKPAGLRTHLLVGLGCCLFVLVSKVVALEAQSDADPGRIAAQVVTGVGFLGGGAILRAGGAVRGLTTAASIWLVAAIGMAAGSGYFVGAGACAAIGFGILAGLERWERRMMGGRERIALRLTLRSEAAARRARETLFGVGLRPDRVEFERGDERFLLTFFGSFSRHAMVVALEHLTEDPEFLGLERASG
ncbi:MAG: hypothetical protein GF346_02640 [Candidatus Eisenbacteria bacterium]|nr:hypothetical protein [Candidatus Latescibacterota bacterium]MBD3301318.1 hypothetical protein [Candidatus Eisenbacteria bacterium]